MGRHRGLNPKTAPRVPALAVAIALAWVCISVAAVPQASAGPDPAAAEQVQEPLTNEDIVRFVLEGVSTAEILRRIQAREPAYDTSLEMVAELRAAGVPDDVIDAMRRRQRRMAPAAEPVEDDWPGDARRLRVSMNPDQTKENRRRIRIEDKIDPDAVAFLDLRSKERRYGDIALFLACTRADHVPDRWRENTPLKWNAEGTPRHRMVAFVPGATKAKASFWDRFGFRPTVDPGAAGSTTAGGEIEFAKGGPPGYLEYVVPAALEADVPNHAGHDLVIGIAFKIGEYYYPWRIDTFDDVVVEDGDVRLTAQVDGIRSGNVHTLEIEFVVEGEEDDEE